MFGRKLKLLTCLLVIIIVMGNTAFAQGSQLRTVHITRALWHGDPQITKEIQNTQFDFMVSTEEAIHGSDMVFVDWAGSEFILRSAGYPDVKAKINGGFQSNRDSGFKFSLENNAQLASDVVYQLIAPSISDEYKWVVENGVEVSFNGSGFSPQPENGSPTKSNDLSQYGSDINPDYNNPGTPLFTDVSTSFWAYATIQEMAKRNVLSGYPDGKFRPNHIVTRAEFAKIMVTASGVQLHTVNQTSFADIKVSDWFAPYVEAAKYYLNGYQMPDGSIVYKPNDAATREDIAVAIVKLKGLNQGHFPDLSIIQTMFKDYDGISAFALNYVALAVSNNLISGYPDETFKPQSALTRAEAAAILYRAYQHGNGNKVDFEMPQIGGASDRIDIPAAPGSVNPGQIPIYYMPFPQIPSTVTDSVY